MRDCEYKVTLIEELVVLARTPGWEPEERSSPRWALPEALSTGRGVPRGVPHVAVGRPLNVTTGDAVVEAQNWEYNLPLPVPEMHFSGLHPRSDEGRGQQAMAG